MFIEGFDVATVRVERAGELDIPDARFGGG